MLTSTDTIRTELENSSPALWINWSSSCAGTLDSSGRLAIANAVCSALFIQQHHRANSLSGASVRTNACTTTTHHATILPCLRSFSLPLLVFRNESMTMTNEVCLESCTAHNKLDQLAIEQLPIVHTHLLHYEIAMNQTHCNKVVIVHLLRADYDFVSCHL